MNATTDPAPAAYTRAEVAALFGVSPRTVTDWDKAGWFPDGAVFRTPGGWRRFRAEHIRALLAGAR